MLRIAAALALLAAPSATAGQAVIPFASGAITAAATADPDELRRPTDPERPAIVWIRKRVKAAPAPALLGRGAPAEADWNWLFRAGDQERATRRDRDASHQKLGALARRQSESRLQSREHPGTEAEPVNDRDLIRPSERSR
jgi:hypothetical protein